MRLRAGWLVPLLLLCQDSTMLLAVQEFAKVRDLTLLLAPTVCLGASSGAVVAAAHVRYRHSRWQQSKLARSLFRGTKNYQHLFSLQLKHHEPYRQGRLLQSLSTSLLTRRTTATASRAACSCVAPVTAPSASRRSNCLQTAAGSQEH